MLKYTRLAVIALMACLALGCATPFSPEMIRQEIVLQRGQAPLGVFELNLGRFTTRLIRSVLTPQVAEGSVPFAGLQQLELAVYEAPSDNGPALDVTRIPIRGWEPLIRLHDNIRSGVILIRSSQEAIGDLVVVGAGRQKVVYARLRGKLSRELPSALGDVLRQQGPDGIQSLLYKLSEGAL
jgi:hypothetical protein